MRNSLAKIRSLNPWTIVANVAVVALLCVWVMAIGAGQRQTLTGVSVDIRTVEGVRDLIIKKEIYRMIQTASPHKLTKLPVGKVDIQKIEETIESDTRVHDAQVYVDAQRVLSVTVDQRRPLIHIKDDGGADYYLDMAGQYVARSIYRAARVPIVTGQLERYDADWATRDDSRIRQAYDIATVISDDEFLTALIEQIHFEKGGRIVMTPKIGKAKVVISDLEDLEHKLGYNLKRFYQELAKNNRWNDFVEIDISYRKQVVPRTFVKT